MKPCVLRALQLLRKGDLVVLLVGAAGLIWSWRTWPDPVIDFGRELYVPWRLGQGDVLYRDIVSFNGPLSHYLLAGWFAITGASLLSLVWLNVAVMAAMLALVHAMVARIAGLGAATIACLTFLGAFAFGQLTPSNMEPMGNFNWICPYSHELTHGIALALLAVGCVYRFAAGSRTVWAAAAGVVLGCVFLTKAEIFAAGAMASAVGLGASLWLARVPPRRSLFVLGAWMLCLVIPGTIATLLLATQMSPDEALRGTLGTWPYLLEATHTDLPYFRWGLGTIDLGASLGRMVFWLCIYAGAFLPVAALAQRVGKARVATLATSLAAAGLVAVAWLGCGWITWFDDRGLLQWNEIARPWQILLLATAVGCVWPIPGRRVELANQPVAVLRLALVTFSLALLGKMFFNVRVYHYGFALAAPAAWIVVALFWSWLPGWMDRNNGNGALLRGAFFAVWCVTLVAHVTHATSNIETKVHTVGNGSDAFLAPARGEVLAAALTFLERHADADDTLAAIPEGAMLNYLARRATPTRFIQYTPPLIILFGEDAMVDSLNGHPPDWVALIHRNDEDYGAPFFGRDYGLKIRAWIDRNYLPVKRFGAPPFRGSDFGVVIMKRRT